MFFIDPPTTRCEELASVLELVSACGPSIPGDDHSLLPQIRAFAKELATKGYLSKQSGDDLRKVLEGKGSRFPCVFQFSVGKKKRHRGDFSRAVAMKNEKG